VETALLGVDCLLVFFLVAFSSRSGTKGGFVECRFFSSCWGLREIKMDGGMESRGDVRIEDLMPRLIAGRKPLVLVLGSLLVAVLVSLLLVFRGGRRSKSSPPVVATIPIIGGLLKFVKGPIIMLAEEYARLGSVFTVKVLTRNVTFLVGPEVSAHFFKAQEADMSQKEVYQFNVPTFGPGVVFDVDYSIRMEQFRFFTEALTVKRLKSYVDFMVEEAEVCCCTAKSSFKVFATADEAKHPQKKEEKQNLICFLFCREPAFSLRQNSFLFNLLVKLLDNVRSLLKL
jgi:hypothetical protein